MLTVFDRGFSLQSAFSVLFRCDGTAQTGLGHVSRCLALAEALQELGFHAVFCGSFEVHALRLLGTYGWLTVIASANPAGEPEDLATMLDILERGRFSGAVFDSYDIDADYLDAINKTGTPSMVIDDYNRLSRYPCTALLNFTVGAQGLGYPKGVYRMFLGPQYFLARRTLRAARKLAKPRCGPVQRLLVSMGGIDRHNTSTAVLTALLNVRCTADIRVVVGQSYADLCALKELSARFSGGCSLLEHLPDLGSELARADACICGGGLTKYECAYMGVPAAAVSQTADEATETLAFVEHGAAINWAINDAKLPLEQGVAAFLCDHSGREQMSRAGLALFPVDPTLQAANGVDSVCQGAGASNHGTDR